MLANRGKIVASLTAYHSIQVFRRNEPLGRHHVGLDISDPRLQIVVLQFLLFFAALGERQH